MRCFFIRFTIGFKLRFLVINSKSLLDSKFIAVSLAFIKVLPLCFSCIYGMHRFVHGDLRINVHSCKKRGRSKPQGSGLIASIKTGFAATRSDVFSRLMFPSNPLCMLRSRKNKSPSLELNPGSQHCKLLMLLFTALRTTAMLPGVMCIYSRFWSRAHTMCSFHRSEIALTGAQDFTPAEVEVWGLADGSQTVHRLCATAARQKSHSNRTRPDMLRKENKMWSKY